MFVSLNNQSTNTWSGHQVFSNLGAVSWTAVFANISISPANLPNGHPTPVEEDPKQKTTCQAQSVKF